MESVSLDTVVGTRADGMSSPAGHGTSSMSFVLIHSTENARRFVVEKQMAQLLFRRRSLPDAWLDEARDDLLEIDRDQHEDVFQVVGRC